MKPITIVIFILGIIFFVIALIAYYFTDIEYLTLPIVLKSKTSGIKITGNMNGKYIYVKVVPFET